MKKYMYFRIKTFFSEETYICEIDTNSKHSVEYQFDEFLAKFCYCDAYEIVSYRDCTEAETVAMTKAMEVSKDEWEAQFTAKEMCKVSLASFVVGANYYELLMKSIDNSDIWINDEISFFTGGYIQVSEAGKSMMIFVDDDGKITECIEGNYTKFLQPKRLAQYAKYI